ncbi:MULTISPECIES: translation elongation factor Ts [Atopobiaceae]|uniref:translation elongation factor Ts n=1 Tax=Atopobiaceae TaxID=1643824 RepID=UPI00034E4885|nr:MULTISPECIES: translation elongation factor Ts [Atopobiaceae]EPD78091.1 translation elongation factor Ts [Atopobium sp. oral taxon 199 str. F0494]
MAQITAALVKQLRDMTSSPMMECKKALVEADGDIDKAIDILRTMGVAKAVKRAGRETNEGTIATFISPDCTKGAILELSCETDFVGTNPQFTGFASDLAEAVVESDPSDVDAFLTSKFGEGTVQEALTDKIHNIGENMRILRFARVQVSSGALSSYIHLGGKLATVVTFEFDKPETRDSEDFKNFAHDVAMQVAAAAPVAARREDVPADIVEHELSIYKAQAAESGKPEAIQERMAQGRLEKYYKENVLTEQAFVKDPDMSINEYAKLVSKKVDDNVQVVSFVRFSFGE